MTDFFTFIRLGLIALAYFLSQALAFHFPDSFGLVAAIWPAAGIALASLLLTPRKLWPMLLGCLFAAGIAANLTTDRPFEASVGFMLANICETAASGWLITRMCGGSLRFTRMREVLALSAAASLINAVTSLIGAGAASLVIGARFWAFYGTWWVADGLGLLLVTPLIVVWADFSWRSLAGMRWERIIESAGLFALSCTAVWFAFGWGNTVTHIEIQHDILVVFIIWAAIRFGPCGTATLLGVISLLIVGFTVAGSGTFPLGGVDATMRLLAAQMFLGMLGLTGLMLAAAFSQQKESEAVLRASEERHRGLIFNLDVGVVVYASDASVIMSNPRASELLGLSESQIKGKKAFDHQWKFISETNIPLPLEEYPVNQIVACKKPIQDRLLGVKRPATNDIVWVMVNGLPILDGKGELSEIIISFIDITARKQAERKLQEKNAEMERFLYTASHDLKSPVVTVQTFLGYLEQDIVAADAGRIEKDTHYIRSAANKMARLLDELLEVSRIGRVVSPPVRVTLRNLADEALNAVAGFIAERGVTVTVDDSGVTLHGDRTRLVEIWQNLMENACKFMGDQKEPRLEIGVEARGAETVFFVRDNGIGIEPRYHTKVFDLFEKLDAKAAGTGLGLAMVKRIVELYNGRIWVESAGHAQGACFYFTLPAADGSQRRQIL